MTARFARPLEERFEEAMAEIGKSLRQLRSKTMWLETGCAVTCYIGTISASYTSGDPMVVLPGGATIGPCQHVSTYTPTASATVLMVPVGQSYVVVGAVS